MPGDEEWEVAESRSAPRLLPDPTSTANAASSLPLQDPAQRIAYDSLSVALQEGYVFAALTGPAAAGKSTVLEAVLADLPKRSVRCIRISDPDKVPSKLAAQIEQVAHSEAAKPENADKHIVLAVDDAHTASDELLRCLARIAAIRQVGQRIPQVVVAGQPSLWDRLATEEFEPLARRIAVRAVLPAAYAKDPWASVEHELTQALAPRPPLHAGQRPPFFDPIEMPVHASDRWEDHPQTKGTANANATANAERVQGRPPPHVAPPTLYALFPQGAPHAATPAKRRSRRPLLISLAAICVTLAAGLYVLTAYDWPDMLTDPPQAEAPKPIVAMVAPTAPTAAMAPPPIAAPPTAAPPAAAPQPRTSQPALASLPTAPEHMRSEPEPAVIAPTPPRPAASPTPAPIALAPVSTAVIALLVRRGDDEAALGDVSAARLLYQRAAEAGSAQAARMTARTYDDAFLAGGDAAAMADPAAARAWYGRAAALGDAEAINRLKILNGGR